MSFDRDAELPWFARRNVAGRVRCSMAFGRDVLDAVSGFDEALDMGAMIGGGGDLDIFGRLLRLGVRAQYVPDARVSRPPQHHVATGMTGVGLRLAQGALACKMWWRDRTHRRAARAFCRERLLGAAERCQLAVRGHESVPPYLSLLEIVGIVAGVLAYPLAVIRHGGGSGRASVSPSPAVPAAGTSLPDGWTPTAVGYPGGAGRPVHRYPQALVT